MPPTKIFSSYKVFEYNAGKGPSMVTLYATIDAYNYLNDTSEYPDIAGSTFGISGDKLSIVAATNNA